MLVPGLRLIERPGALHLFDGRRVVSLTGDEHVCAAFRTAMNITDAELTAPTHQTASDHTDVAPLHPPDATAVADARRVLAGLSLVVPDAPTPGAPDTRAADLDAPRTGAARPSADATAGAGTIQADAASRALLSRARPAAVSADFVSAATGGWVSAPRALGRLRATTVHLWAPAQDNADDPTQQHAIALANAVRACGIRIRRLGRVEDVAGLDPAADIVAALAPDRDPVHPLVAVNSAAVAAGVSFFPVGVFDGARLHVGPLVVPGQSACLDCMRRRAAANVAFTDLYDTVTAAPGAPTPSALRDWSHSVAALALLRWIGERDVRIPGRVFTLVPDELQIRQAVVYRVPRCRVCAAPDYLVRAAPWEAARDH